MTPEQAASEVVELRRQYHEFVKLADQGTRTTTFYLSVRAAYDSLVCLLDEVEHAEDGSWSGLADSYEELLRRVAQ